MITSQQCLKKYGDPELHNNMVMWDIPAHLEVFAIPKRLYCNKDIIEPLAKAFEALIYTGCASELKTFDGCFNIRKKRGLTSMSLHSWGIAIDVNAFENQLGTTGKLSAQFVGCFTKNGFEWGGNWTSRPDPMHFQLATI